MRNIINDLSEITKAENQYKEEAEAVKLANIIEEVKMILNENIVRNQVKIHLDLKEPEIQFPRKNLRSIIFNLLSNAIKYQSPDRKPEIHIMSHSVDGQVHLSIKDNGIGIAQDKMGLLFAPYSRIEKKVEGTGIGLYLVKKIVENAGGKIEVNSKLGEGSVFTIYLSKFEVNILQ